MSDETNAKEKMPILTPETPMQPEGTEHVAETPIPVEPTKQPIVAPVSEPQPSPIAPEAQSQAPVSAEDAFKEDIEDILEEDVEAFYQKMSPEEQQKFKHEGEVAVGLIASVLSQVKVQVKSIISLLVKWLVLIPGVNKFFVEQEARKKTTQLIQLKEEHDKIDHVDLV